MVHAPNQDMRLREIMRPGALAVEAGDSLGDAYAVMMRSRVRHVPVTSEGRIVGMLSERDVLAARARAGERDWRATPVQRAMRASVQVAQRDDSIAETMERMASEELGALPVIEHGKLLGIITVSDLLDAEVRAAMGPGPASFMCAADVMTPYPATVSADALLVDAIQLMADRHVRHLPVVDATNAVVGMLTDRDIRTAIGHPLAYREAPSGV